jgi:hypothetical protein
LLLLGACTAGTSASGTGGDNSSGSGGTQGSAGATGAGGATGSGGRTATGAGGSGAGGATTTGAGGATTGAGGATTGAGGTTGGTGGTTTGAGGNGTGTGGVSGGAGTTGTCPALPTAPLPAASIIQFNDNGGWSWYQDERAVVDTNATPKKLIIGSTASGGARNGQNEAVIYDLTAKTSKRYTLPSSLATSNVDDHNAPAILIRPDGKYLAQWSGHRVDCLSRFSIFDGTNWGTEQKLDWTPLGCPWPGQNTNMITYSNPWYIGSTIFSAVRSVDTDPGVITSTDNGATWSYYGKLSSSPQVGYVAGYYKYWGNNTDRIDFVGTEAHPRDFDNSLYHGYVSAGKVYDSLGNVLDSSLKDPSSTSTNAANITGFTQVFKTGATIGGVKLCRAWNYDIVRYADGTVAVLGQARADTCTSTPATSDPDKRAIYARFDGTKWSQTYLVKMGPKLYPDEQDYTGLAALSPDNPNIIYLSSVYDPRDDKTMTSKHEIYEGVTCDNGATFHWAPLTQNSTVDNIRPIVPRWDSSHTALLWMKGTYTTAQNYATAIVGTISGP